MNSSEQIKLGAFIGYVAIAVNVVAGLLYTPWVISVLGSSDYGLYTLATSLISLFVFDFGISSAVSRFVVRAHVAGDEKRVGQILGAVYKLYFVIDIVIVMVLALVMLFLEDIYGGLTAEELERLRVVFLIVGVYNVLIFPTVPFAGILSAYEEFVPLKLCDIFNKLFSILCIVAALLAGGGLYALVFLNALAGLLTAGLKYVLIRKETGVKANLCFWSRSLFKEIFSFSVWTTVSSLALRLTFNVAPSVLGAVANSAAVAVFGVASTIEGYVSMISSAVNGLFVARVADISLNRSSSSREELVELMVKVGRIQFMIIGLVFVVFLTAGHSFVLLWVGKDYELTYYGAVLLLAPQLFSSSQQVAETVVSIENKVRQQGTVYFVMAIISIGLMVPLSFLFGSLGACVSICAAYFVRTALMNILYYRDLNLNVFAFYKQCYTTLWLPLFLGYLSGTIFSAIVPITTWPLFLIECLVICFVYMVVLKPLLNEFEKNQIRLLLNKFGGR